jgi:glutamyl-tRNA synthetase
VKVTTRFAPSPTGYLHIGGVRTALFNYIFAKKFNGTFLVRIEDTDKERSKAEYIKAIMDGLDWIGLNPDQQPIKQSDRFHVYKDEAFKLVKEGKAYEDDGAIRLKTDKDGSTLVKDLVYGDIDFPNKELDDLVILRSDESPTYHFCNVIDDNYQNVTHIIRGEDHLPNTPKQIQIVNALGYKGFEYIHLPLVLGEDRKRLSKRHAATDLMSYRQEGYLPEAVLNMLAKLGWSNTTEDIFGLDKLINIFEVQDIQKAGAVFDIERLNFVNQAHIANMKIDTLMKELESFNKKNGFSLNDHHDGEYLLELCKGSANNLSEISLFIKPFLVDFDDYNSDDFDKHMKNAESVITYFKINLEQLDLWSEESIEKVIEAAKNELDLPMPKIGLPLRVALLGRAKSPQLDSTIYLIEKEKVIERLSKALVYITEH